MNFSISTAWMDGDISRLYTLLPYIDFIEIGSKGNREFFELVAELVHEKRIQVTSIHAIAGPHKKEKDASYAPNFASFEETLRQKDIEDVRLTAEWALKLGVKPVVLHIGKIDDEKLRNDYLLYRDLVTTDGFTPKLESMRKELISRREMLSKKYLDIVIKELDKLCRSFQDVTFCLETRMHYYEIPLPAEAQYIFNKLPYPNLGYWHDIGHTYNLDRLRLVPMHEWQTCFAKRCIGLHIHDVGHDLQDHYPPGHGSLNLQGILEQFGKKVLFTLEINSRHTENEVIRGIKYLKRDIIDRISSL